MIICSLPNSIIFSFVEDVLEDRLESSSKLGGLILTGYRIEVEKLYLVLLLVV